MNTQDEIKALKQRITELEQQDEQEQALPQEGGNYWWINDEGGVYRTIFLPDRYEEDSSRLKIGNLFKTEQDAHFAVEKLKVEAELRKFSRPFECGEINQYIFLDTDRDRIDVENRYHFPTQGTIYFDSKEKVQQALKSVGADRIKKYIFGVEE